MSFLSDLGGFLGEVKEFSDQIDGVKQEVTSSVVDAITQGKTITNTVVSDVSDSVTTVQQTASSTVDDVVKSLKN